MDAAIATYELTRRFRRSRLPWRRGSVAAVDGVSLEVPAGSIYGLVGPNGAGKTTLMRLLLGLLRPTAGEVLLLGSRHGLAGSPALRQVGALIEEPRFVPFLSARENLLQVATLLGGDAPGSIDAALADVGLADRAGDNVGGFSLGMRQRLGLARCLLGRPSLLVLDEPTNGMDPQGIADTRELLQRYVREHGATVLLSSHLLEGVEQLCDAVAFMDAGRIVRAGSLAGLASATSSYRIHVSRPGEALAALEELQREAAWQLSSSEHHEADGVLTITVQGEHDAADLNRELVERGFAVRALVPLNQSLEAVYRETIGGSHAVRWSE